VLISTKHEPFDRSETLRIRSAEGWVSLHGQVNDKLDVSRGFGHYHLAPIVNAAPAVTQIDLTDADEFVILANRTLWDFISYQTAVDIARMNRDDPMMAAQRLRDFAISYGAEESIMVMIVAVGDLFREARGQGTTPNAIGNPFGLFNESSSPAYDVEQFKKITPRRAREDRDLIGDRTLARLQREVPPPIGHVALVFTDIKNSTSLWETNGGMQSAMRLHNFLLRRQLRNIGGYEVKTEGDAFMVSFQTVTSALLWCFQVQIHLLKENWPQELLESEDGKAVFDEETGELLHRGLSVRMGIHWGWPVCEADPITRRMDYFGPMVNRASRISGAADGGQIMVSKDVVNELRAIMGTFDDDNNKNRVGSGGSNNGDASSKDGLGDDLAEDDVEEAFRLLHPNVSRDVILLRRMGFAISDMGERRLKGLEMPELLNIIYPKSLTRRYTKMLQGMVEQQLQSSNSIKAVKEEEASGLSLMEKGKTIPKSEVFEATVQMLDHDEVQAVGLLCLRLESLAQGKVFKGIDEIAEAEISGSGSSSDERLRASMDDSIVSPSGLVIRNNRAIASSRRQIIVESFINRHPEFFLHGLREEATDDELCTLLKHFIGRIWIALSNLSIRTVAGRIKGGGGGGGDGGLGNDPLGLGVDIMDLVDMLLQKVS
jgi:adenylate cyclase